MRTAAEKLQCIKETAKIIENSYKLMSRGEKNISADDFTPLLILVLIRAAPKRLISSIKYCLGHYSFIESFASASKLLSNEGYFLTQIRAAIHFCDTATSDNIELF